MERIGLEIGTFVAVALCGDVGGGPGGGAAGDAARARRLQDHAGEDTNKKDARGIAQLMRLGWFRPVHCKSLPARKEVRAVLTSRKLLQGKLHDVEMGIRGDFAGLRIERSGTTTPKRFAGRIRELVGGQRDPADRSRRRCWRCTRCCGASSTAWRSGCAVMARDRCAGAAVDDDARGRARSWRSPMRRRIDDPGRFKILEGGRGAFRADAEEVSVRARPTLPAGSSKVGDAAVRTALYEAAHVMLTQAGEGLGAQELGAAAGQAGRHEARRRWRSPASWRSCLHRMLVDGTSFASAPGPPVAAAAA